MGASVPPVFVVGCGRSGTTLLRLMLDAHPDLAVPGESHFIPQLASKHGTGPVDADAVARDLMATPHFRHWKVPERDVWERVRSLGSRASLADVIAAAYLTNADALGKSRWGDKTPIYVLDIPLISRLWPEARFVHLIRDGRDVALSYLSLHWGPATIWAAARKWRRDVTAGIRDGRPLGPSRYLEMRYETLTSDLEGEMLRLCSFAGLGFDAAMLDTAAREGHATLAPEEGRAFHERSERDVEPDARDWRSQMADDDVRRFEAVAGELLEDLGYERRFPHVPPVDRVQGAVRATALDLIAIGANAKKRILRRVSR